jgi:protein-tyrosine-phosphatase
VKHVLFVCTGNTCRSPMAEGIFRKMIQDRGLKADIRSAGTYASDGAPASHNTLTILREKGINGNLASKSITAADVMWSNLILTMTMNHKQQVIQRYPDAVDKTFTLKEYVQNNTAALHGIKERERLYAEWQIKQALGQPISEEERARMDELQASAPDFDINDPFGGPMEDYRQCAEQLEGCLKKLLDRIYDQN